MTAWICVYLLIGFYFAFITFISIEESGMNKDYFLFTLPSKMAFYLYSHPILYKLFIIIFGIGLCIIWPYILYTMYKNDDYEW